MKKGNLLTWIGLIGSFGFGVLSFLGDSTSGVFTVPVLVPLGMGFFFISLLALVVGVWGSVSLLKAKHQSLWWLLVLLPTPVGPLETLLFLVPILLKDRSAS